MKTLIKRIIVAIDGTLFNVEIRSSYYSDVKNPHWGDNFFSATFVKSGNSIGGSAMMKKSSFLSQLEIAAKHLN